jgi:hypothetical protein
VRSDDNPTGACIAPEAGAVLPRNESNTTHGRCSTSSSVKQALYPIDTLNLANVIHERIQAHKILDIQTYRTLEDAIV